MHINNPHITDWQKQIIIGTILGGSSIVKTAKSKNSYLAMRDKNERWLRYKAQELNNLATDHAFIFGKTNRWRSISFPIFNDLRNQFYDDNNKVFSLDILDGLRDIGLAVWFGDCGGVKSRIPFFRCSKVNQKIVHHYFELLQLDPEIRKNKIFVCNVDSFLKVVIPCLPEFYVREMIKGT